MTTALFVAGQIELESLRLRSRLRVSGFSFKSDRSKALLCCHTFPTLQTKQQFRKMFCSEKNGPESRTSSLSLCGGVTNPIESRLRIRWEMRDCWSLLKTRANFQFPCCERFKNSPGTVPTSWFNKIEFDVWKLGLPRIIVSLCRFVSSFYASSSRRLA